MERDLRDTAIFRETEAFFRRALEPGFGRATELHEPRPRPDGSSIAYTGRRLTGLEGLPQGRVCLLDVRGEATPRDVTNGPNDDGDPRWSPDGRMLTFRSDRAQRGCFQLYRLDSDGVGEARALATVPGTVEYHRWSPDGRRILVGVAGLRAEQADALGSGTLGRDEDDAPSWLPEVRSPDDEPNERRGLWSIAPWSDDSHRLADATSNVWEADWCGPGAVVAIVSPEPDEGAWYYASLVSIDTANGRQRTLLESDVQLGWVAGSPDGRTVALIEARCSDRLLLAGTLVLIDTASGDVRRLDTAGADITWLSWRPTGRLLATGLRRTSTVVLDVDAMAGEAHDIWSSPEASGDYYPVAEPVGDGDAFVTVMHSLDRAPELVHVGSGPEAETRVLVSTANAGTEFVRGCIGRRQLLTWPAPDGLDIDGFVTLPAGAPPFPLLVHVHGGPVWAYQDRFPGVLTSLPVSRGYAVLEPNPRGSGGRGRAFADMVVGDMGGADARDILSGIDELVRRGLIDPERVAVLGGSYGGFMSCWLPAMDDRFKAAVAISPVSDWVSQHFTSSLARWDADFLGGAPEDPDGPYRERSPVFRAAGVTTPTLLTAGLRDRATPAGQAVEFHQALRSRGVPSDVVVYPEEGHGVSAFPTLIDLAARCQEWLERFLPRTRLNSE